MCSLSLYCTPLHPQLSNTPATSAHPQLSNNPAICLNTTHCLSLSFVALHFPEILLVAEPKLPKSACHLSPIPLGGLPPSRVVGVSSVSPYADILRYRAPQGARGADKCKAVVDPADGTTQGITHSLSSFFDSLSPIAPSCIAFPPNVMVCTYPTR